MKKKILILRFSSIGDIVLTSPVIRCIHEQLTDAEIHYATKKQYAGMLKSNPYVHTIHELDNSLKKLIRGLKKERFDFIIDLHKNLRTLIIKSQLHTRSSAFRKLNFEKWLMVNFKINRLPDEHIVDRYLKAAVPLGIQNDGKGLDYFIPETDIVPLSELPPAFHAGYVCVVTGAMHETKKLTNKKLHELLNRIQSQIILIGGKDEYEDGERLAEIDPKKILNACGKYSVNQSASLIRQATMIITPDTGMMHIAAAFKKDIISVWGNTIPEFGMYPYNTTLREQRDQNKILEVNHLSCRPCSKIGFNRCPKGHFKCMKQIDFDKLPL